MHLLKAKFYRNLGKGEQSWGDFPRSNSQNRKFIDFNKKLIPEMINDKCKEAEIRTTARPKNSVIYLGDRQQI